MLQVEWNGLRSVEILCRNYRSRTTNHLNTIQNELEKITKTIRPIPQDVNLMRRNKQNAQLFKKHTHPTRTFDRRRSVD